MSVNGLGALERGDRRYPYAETVALLADALGLEPDATVAFAAAAARPQARGGVHEAKPHNLAFPMSSFVGRDAEVAEIAILLEANRLVTLVGAGGIGKTRMSLRVGERLLDAWRDGVWFVELAPLSSGDYIPSTVAAAMHVTLGSAAAPIDALIGKLRARRALLIVDNCEHLVDSAAQFVLTILRGCPEMRVLATSRQGLGLDGEALYRMPPLTFPSVAEASRLSAAAAQGYSAITLCVARARATNQDFTLRDDAVPAIAEICRRLDGIPLAIELAATRLKMLDPQQLRERLDERFRILTGGRRDVLPRQQTLRALIDWSYDLLDEREQRLFRQLGIFVNGFTLDGATAIGNGIALEEHAVFDVLSSLVDKSLVLADPGVTGRYRLLETTRLYALEKLVTQGGRDHAARQHLSYLRDLLTEAARRFEESGRNRDIDDVFAAELEDVRSALDWASPENDATRGAELLAAIGCRWIHIGLQREGQERLNTFLAALAGGGEPAILSQLWVAFAKIAIYSGTAATPLAAAEKAIAFARVGGVGRLLARALEVYARNQLYADGFHEARAALVEAEAIAGAGAALRIDLLETRAVLSTLDSGNDFEAAVRFYERLRSDHRALGNAKQECKTVLLLAEVEHRRGNTRRAIGLVPEVLPIARADSNRIPLTVLLSNFAGYLVAMNDLTAAADAAREVICERAPSDPDFHTIVANATEHLALVYALSGEYGRAARLAGYADTAPHPLGFVRTATERITYDRLSALLRDNMAPNVLATLFAEGEALTNEGVLAAALDEPLRRSRRDSLRARF